MSVRKRIIPDLANMFFYWFAILGWILMVYLICVSDEEGRIIVNFNKFGEKSVEMVIYTSILFFMIMFVVYIAIFRFKKRRK